MTIALLFLFAAAAPLAHATRLVSLTGRAGAPFYFQLGNGPAIGRFSADNLPAGLSLDPATALLTGRVAAPLAIDLRVNYSAAGNVSRYVIPLRIVPAERPVTSTDIAAVGTPLDRVYRQGDGMTFALSYRDEVRVTGAPRLVLRIDQTTRYATYRASASDAHTLVFDAPIVRGDADHDGITVAPQVDLNGGAIVNAAGQPMGIDLPALDTTGVRVDAWVETARATGIVRPAAGTYRAGSVIAIGVTFDREVSYTGRPRIPLQVGNAARFAVADAVIERGQTMIFRYTVAPGDAAPNGLTMGNAIDLDGGTMTAFTPLDDASIPRSARDLSAIRIDTSAPTSAPVVEPMQVYGTPWGGASFLASIWGTGSPVSYSAEGMNSHFGLMEGGALYARSSVPPGRYPVTVSATNAIGRGAATWTLAPVEPLPENRNRLPASNDVPCVGVPPDGLYRAGDTLTFAVHISGAMLVGEPQLRLRIGAQTRVAAFAAEFLPRALVFRYRVQPDDVDADGIELISGLGLGDERCRTIHGYPHRDYWVFRPDTTRILVAPVAAPIPPPPPPPAPALPPPSAVPPTPPPPVDKVAQTIAFSSPVSSFVIGQPISLGATSSAGLPITYAVVSGRAAISGSTLTATGPGEVIVRASQPGNDTVAAASIEVNFGAPARAAQAITLTLPATVAADAAPLALGASSSAGLPVTFTVVSGPATIADGRLTLTGAAGTVVVRASQVGNDTYLPASDVTHTFAIVPVGPQVYFGTAGEAPLAAVVARDGGRAALLVRLAEGEAVAAKFRLNADGTFTTTTRTLDAASREITLAGRVTGGVVSGTIGPMGISFTARVQPATGATASFAGLYQAAMPGSAAGTAYLALGATGEAYALALTPTGALAGKGSVSTGGAVDVSFAPDAALRVTLGSDATLTGSVTAGATTRPLAGLADAVARTDRLVNLSSRLRVAAGDGSRAVMAGFVVSGAAAQPMLIRAVGPGLAAFGLTDVVSTPGLQIFNQAGGVVAENSGWNNSPEIGAAAAAVGAFRLPAGSRDAAAIVTLPPGAYTAQVTTSGSTGLVLIEVYDVSGAAAPGGQLANISTRGFVEPGAGELIAGFVVRGNVPKRVLIRGIGPALSAFGVPGALGDPVLRLHAGGGGPAMASNDNWDTPQPADTAHAPATAAEIVAAASAAGAFPLPRGSKDAVIVITLAPGEYTAAVSGAGGATGAALVEVYPLPE